MSIIPVFKYGFIIFILFYFFKDFIYLFTRERERERSSQRWREKQAPFGAGSLMQDSIPGPLDHDLSQKQTLNPWATQVPLTKGSN